MPDGKRPSIKKLVSDLLTKDGMSYREIQAKIEGRPTTSNLNKVLRKLEADGFAVREKVVRGGPGYRVVVSIDRMHEPRVLWRLK